ncbi:methyltransferase CmcJ [Teratosphaeria destructans]|uniref:Methyltransferase CmcJ n=1 Tax=Teratosphaeria destructans TaxID=418781 RepID=A0A9W7SM93_9PEZI|nr:methyltransferase CmcJ [Teratosphaeria destructans]
MPGTISTVGLRATDDCVQLNYLKWIALYEKELPFQTFLPIPPDAIDQRRHNLVQEEGPPQVIEDIRGRENEFHLDVHGFQFFQHASALQGGSLYDKAAIKGIYLQEFAKFLQDNLDGADHIVVFDWRLRKATMNEKAGRLMDYTDKLQRVGPTPRVHVDCTDAGLMRRIESHCGKKAWKLLRGRVRMINMWRPVGAPIVDCPLALCDGRSYPNEGIVGVNMHKPGFLGVSGAATYREGMKWYYMNRQQDDEPVVFKNFDSDETVTPLTLHTAFYQSSIPPHSAPRESIEARALVFTDPLGEESVDIRVELDE